MNADLHIPDDKLRLMIREVVKEVMADNKQRKQAADDLLAESSWSPQDGEWCALDEYVGMWRPACLHRPFDMGGGNLIDHIRQVSLFERHNLRPATNAEVADVLRLKKGDVIAPWKKDDPSHGKYFTFDHIDDEGFVCAKLGEHCRGFEGWCCRFNEIHLVHRASAEPVNPNKPEHDFQLREVLRVKETNKRGRIGVVENIDTSNAPIDLRFSDGSCESFRVHELHRETHAEARERLKAGIGDKVRVVGTSESEIRGWELLWIPHMDVAVGKVGRVVADCGSQGFQIHIDGLTPKCIFPAFVLELVERAEKVSEKPHIFEWLDQMEVVEGNHRGKQGYVSGTLNDGTVRAYDDKGNFIYIQPANLRLLRPAAEVKKLLGIGGGE